MIAKTAKEKQDAFFVRKEVFVKEQHVPIEEEIDSFEDEAIHFVLYENELPVGAGRFRVVDDYGKVERICILPSVRGTGAGRLIMETIEDYAKNEQLKTLKLNAQIQAEGFYTKLGYETISGQFMDAGIPHVTMIKPLESASLHA